MTDVNEFDPATHNSSMVFPWYSVSTHSRVGKYQPVPPDGNTLRPPVLAETLTGQSGPAEKPQIEKLISDSIRSSRLAESGAHRKSINTVLVGYEDDGKSALIDGMASTMSGQVQTPAATAPSRVGGVTQALEKHVMVPRYCQIVDSSAKQVEWVLHDTPGLKRETDVSEETIEEKLKKYIFDGVHHIIIVISQKRFFDPKEGFRPDGKSLAAVLCSVVQKLALRISVTASLVVTKMDEHSIMKNYNSRYLITQWKKNNSFVEPWFSVLPVIHKTVADWISPGHITVLGWNGSHEYVATGPLKPHSKAQAQVVALIMHTAFNASLAAREKRS